MLKKILKFLLSMLLFTSLLTLSFLTILNENTSKYKKEEIHQNFDQIFIENKISIEIIDTLIDIDQNKKIIKEYMNAHTKLSLKGEIAPTTDMKNLLQSVIYNYNIKNNLEQQNYDLEKLTSDFTKKIIDIIRPMPNNFKINNIISFLINDTVYYSLFVIVSLLILFIAIVLKKEAFTYLGTICILNGILLGSSYFLTKIDETKNIMDFFIQKIDFFYQNTFSMGGIFILVGIILWLCNYLWKQK